MTHENYRKDSPVLTISIDADICHQTFRRLEHQHQQQLELEGFPENEHYQCLTADLDDRGKGEDVESDLIKTVCPEWKPNPTSTHPISEHHNGYWSQNGVGFGVELDTESAEMAAAVRAVALHLEGTLRAAKKAHLSCGEVLLPPDLLTRVSRDIIRMAETEPCGLRGCLILLSFESGQLSHHQSTNLNNNNSANNRKIGKVKCDSQTVTTFELHLTLREDLAPWYSRLPQILRNLTKGGTIVVSPAYTIAKKKLYRSH